MASAFAGIEIGKRSLDAHNQSITTAGHNITNAGTEGYSRQRVQVKTFEPIYRPDLSRAGVPGQIGQGAVAESVNRVRDEMLDQRITAQTNQESFWATREKYMQMLEQIYNEPADVSIRSNMDKFWEGWQELSVHPESQAARQAVVTRANTLTESIQQRFESLSGVGNLINGDIEATVRQVNSFASQIAELNNEIVRSRAMGDNPNDLLDRRDLLVDKLASLVNVSSDQRDSDEFMVHVDGHILVQGNVARSLDTVTPGDNNGYSKVIWKDTGLDAEISGGSLGALIGLRDVDVREEIQSLNTMTLNFADLVNDVHRNAVGANGVTGQDFFVQQPFVTNVNGNYDADGDGNFDHSYIFRMTGTNSLNAQDQIGLEGVMTLSGQAGNVEIAYHATDTVEDVINRINDSTGEVKAYLDKNHNLVLKASASQAPENPDFVIRYIEDSGFFLSGYSGILSGAGPENAYDFTRPDAVNVLAGAQTAVSPVLNPAAYISVNKVLQNDVMGVAAAYPSVDGLVNMGDGKAAVDIAAIRNWPMMIGRERTLDDYFADSVTNIGLKGEQAQTNLASQNALMADLRNLRDSVSGVNIDEELADIMKFQHGYNAAAKYVTVVDEMLDTIINRLGV